MFFTLTHGGVLDYRNQRSARKHRDDGLATLSHGSLNAVRYYRIPRLITPRACWSPQACTPSSHTILSFHKAGSHNLQLPALPLPGCADMPLLGCTSIGEKSVCHDWSQRQALFTASQHSGSPEFHVARKLCTPSWRTCSFRTPS